MRRALVCLLLLACAGCEPDGRPAGYVPDEARQAQVDADIALANEKVAPPQAGATVDASLAAGIAASSGDDESGISPIPFFHGGDAQWRIEIQSVGDLRHDVTLHQGPASMRGTLTYRPIPGTGDDGPFDLDGALYAPQGDAPMHVHLGREPCLDDAGAHGWKVQVYVDGQAPRDGCGDIAMQ
jgi:hypothetical protein